MSNIVEKATAIKGYADKAGAIGTILSENSGSSITRLAKDLIFQTPVMISGSINYDEVFPIVKGLEKNYASLFFAAITAEGIIDKNKHGNTASFLKTFHNNINLPTDAVESVVPDEDLEYEASAIVQEGYLSPTKISALWDCMAEQVSKSKINDIYTPFKFTERKVSEALEAAHTIANEANENYFRSYASAKDENGKTLRDKNNNIIMNTGKDGLPQFEYILASKDTRVLKEQSRLYGEAKKQEDWRQYDDTNKNRHTSKMNESLLKEKREYEANDLARTKIDAMMINDTMFSAMSPTMMKLSLAVISGNRNAFTHTFVIGVKAMPRVIKSSLLIANMVEAFKNRNIFKFIKWTNGERKTVDLLFGLIDSATGFSKSRDSIKYGSKWVKALNRRAAKNRIPFVGKKINPITSIIITEAEAYEIKKLTGIDPNSPAAASKMMRDHSILCLCIYDTEEKMVKMMFDGANSFEVVSIRTMLADVNKQINLDSSRR